MLLVKLVEIVNQEIVEIIGKKFSKQYPVRLEYRNKGYASEIYFSGIKVWSSESDNRNWTGKGEQAKQESLETFLRREINKIAAAIGKIQIKQD